MLTPAIVVVPGLWSGRDFWSVLLEIADFKPKDWRVLEVPWVFHNVPVRWGFGAEMMEFYRQMDDLIVSGCPVILLAHSYGAQHALTMIDEGRINVEKLVLLAPALGRGWWFAAGWRITTALCRAGLKLLQGLESDENLVVNPVEKARWLEFVEKSRNYLERPPLKGLLMQVLAGGVQALRGLDVGVAVRRDIATLVVWGSEDRLLPPKKLPRDIEQLILPEAGHFMFLGEKRVWRMIMVWLGRGV